VKSQFISHSAKIPDNLNSLVEVFGIAYTEVSTWKQTTVINRRWYN